MDKFHIEGGHKLSGEIPISGAKNAALPALAASLLTAEEVVLDRIPEVRDIRTMARLLESIGAAVQKANNQYRIRAKDLTSPEASYDLVKTMRASSLVLGPLVARTGRARVSLPGGCAIGARPINLHLSALEKLGATISQAHGYVQAEAPGGLQGAHISFDRITVTGTEDILMAAVLADGETVLENAAREPEVVDLADLLIQMGASIEGAGSSVIRVRGVSQLRGARHSVIGDRIEAGTFLIAGALCGGELSVSGVRPAHLEALLAKMRQAGADVSESGPETIRVAGGALLRAADVATKEHPGFATDMQAQWMAMMTQAEGESAIVENIFENRFMHVSELVRMGARISLHGNRAVVHGRSSLSGANVMASDLRASASLAVAALVARGQTVIDRVYHIDRGYEKIEEKLAAAGAWIRRVN